MHASLQATGAAGEKAVVSTEEKPRSKFSKRFNMTGSGMTQTNDATSTTVSQGSSIKSENAGTVSNSGKSMTI